VPQRRPAKAERGTLHTEQPEQAALQDSFDTPQSSAFILQRSALKERIPPPLRALLSAPVPLLKLLTPPFLISCGAALLIPYLSLFYRERFGVSNTTLGLVFACLDLATGAALLVAPLIAGRLGKMPAVVLTRALALPFTLLMGFAPDLAFSAGAALARVALFNMAAPLYDAFAMERSEEDARPFVIGLLGAAYSIGYVVGPGLSALVQERYGFGPIFVATTALYALSVLLTWLFFVRGVGDR
jgi:predicted MFS family arabinose efflux permease